MVSAANNWYAENLNAVSPTDNAAVAEGRLYKLFFALYDNLVVLQEVAEPPKVGQIRKTEGYGFHDIEWRKVRGERGKKKVRIEEWRIRIKTVS